jgi:hypothetical protein
VALALIKAIHTLAWFSIEGCMVYVLYAGFARRSDRRAGIAGVVAAESLIFARNGFRCPLTQVAERLGAERARSPTSTCPGGSPATCRYPRPADRPGRIPACQKPPRRALIQPGFAGPGADPSWNQEAAQTFFPRRRNSTSPATCGRYQSN